MFNAYRCRSCDAGGYSMEKTGQFFYWSDVNTYGRLAKPVPLGLLLIAKDEEI